MATKVIYFTVEGKPEQAEFRSDDTHEEVRGIPTSVSVSLTHLKLEPHFIINVLLSYT